MTPTHDSTKFLAMFWDARRLMSKGDEGCRYAFLRLAEYARAQGQDDWTLIAESALLEAKGEYKQAEDLLRTSLHELASDAERLTLFVLGSILQSRGDPDQAISCYDQALNGGLERGGYAWNNMGLAYADKGDYDNAIRCYEHAVELHDPECTGDACLNTANAYRARGGVGDYKKSVDWYQITLSEPMYDSQGDALFGLGVSHYELREYNQAIESLQKCITARGSSRSANACHMLGLSYFMLDDFDAAIAWLTTATCDLSFDSIGDAYVMLGDAHKRRGDNYRRNHEYDAAERENGLATDFYRLATETPGYELVGNAWDNLGTIYADRRDYPSAIACYQRALESPKVTFYPEVGLGLAFIETGEYGKALEFLERALSNPNYETYGDVHLNMAIAHHRRGEQLVANGLKREAVTELEVAVGCYKQAICSPDFETPCAANSLLATVYDELDRPEEALKCIEQLKGTLESSTQRELLRIRHELMTLARLKSEVLRRNRHKRTDRDRDLLRFEIEELERGGDDASPSKLMKLRDIITREDEYDRYTRSPVNVNDDLVSNDERDVLSVLKDWGSAIPLVAGGMAGCRGGGYYFRWQGCGLVVDPGIDFWRNFRDAGFRADDIDAVLVSHNHTDHNNDLRAIDDIKHEIAARRKAEMTGATPVRGYLLALDRGTAKSLSIGKRKTLHRPEGRQLWQELPLGEAGCLGLRTDGRYPFEVTYFTAKHGKGLAGAVGFRIAFYDGDDFVADVGISGDTGFYPQMCEVGLLKGCSLLIAHISQPALHEYDDPDFLKPTHLGYRGVERLVKECAPKLTIVTEFWGGLSDSRISLVQGLRNLCDTEAILPGGVGLTVDLRSLDISCSFCSQWHPHSKMVVAGPDRSLGPLKYLCPHCRL